MILGHINKIDLTWHIQQEQSSGQHFHYIIDHLLCSHGRSRIPVFTQVRLLVSIAIQRQLPSGKSPIKSVSSVSYFCQRCNKGMLISYNKKTLSDMMEFPASQRDSAASELWFESPRCFQSLSCYSVFTTRLTWILSCRGHLLHPGCSVCKIHFS